MQEAIEGRFEVDPSGSIIKLPVAGCPWKEHLAQLEQEQKLGDSIKFCLYEVGCDGIDFSLPAPICRVAIFKHALRNVRILRDFDMVLLLLITAVFCMHVLVYCCGLSKVSPLPTRPRPFLYASLRPGQPQGSINHA